MNFVFSVNDLIGGLIINENMTTLQFEFVLGVGIDK